MLVFAKIKSVQQHLKSLKKEKTIGFVPTMGALHKGHLSLIEKAKKDNNIVVASIFVNPTQFDKKEDLLNYPKTIGTDLERLKLSGCDLVFTPSPQEMYEGNITSQTFDFDGLEFLMEGKFRKGHFDGVGTIVKKLLEVVMPHRIYFGEKDFQQLQIIRKMVSKEEIDVEIVGCPIFREEDGLAMSSRNLRLTKDQRAIVPMLYKTLQGVKTSISSQTASTIKNWVKDEISKEPLLDLEYFEIADERTLKPVDKFQPGKKYRAFIAVFAGDIRLIDNLKL